MNNILKEILSYPKTGTKTTAGPQYGYQSCNIWTTCFYNLKYMENSVSEISYQRPDCRICWPCLQYKCCMCNQYLRNLKTTETATKHILWTLHKHTNHDHTHTAFIPFSLLQSSLLSLCTYLLFPCWIVVLVDSEVGVHTVCVVIHPFQKVVG